MRNRDVASIKIKRDVSYLSRKKKTFSFSDGFPEDFSIIATVRPDEGVEGKIFSMYNDITAQEIMSISVGEGPQFLYRDIYNLPSPESCPRFDITLNDGQ